MKRARLASTAALAALLSSAGACLDSAGPEPKADLVVSVALLRGPTFEEGDQGTQLVRCQVDLRAMNRGSEVTWLDATFHWYAGTDRSVAFDSTVMSQADVQSSWGEPTLGSGERYEVRWEFTAGIPFAATVDYRYRTSGQGQVHTATVAFTCGPEVPAGAEPPSIQELSTPNPVAEPGDPLDVQYTVASGIGLWRTTVQLTGACEAQRTFPERLETTVTRTVRIPLPAECRLGEPLGVTVSAVDGAMQEAARDLATGFSLVDRTPPSVTMSLVLRGALGRTMSGDFFAGDSIGLDLAASDNHALSTIVWEVLPSGDRDSIFVSGAQADPSLRYVHLPLDKAGPIQIRAFARDAAGLTGEPIETAPDSVRVHPTVVYPVVSASVGGEVRGLAIDARRGLIYLAQGERRRVVAVSMATLAVTATVSMPGTVLDVDLTAGGDSLLAVIEELRALAVVDLRQTPLQPMLLPLPELDPGIGQQPKQVRAMANGKAFVAVAGNVARSAALLEVDLRSGAQQLRPVEGEGFHADEIERSLDHSVLFVLRPETECLLRYDAALGTFASACGHRAWYSRALAVDATGQRAAIGLNVYDASLQFLRAVRSARPEWQPNDVALSADGAAHYQATSSYGIIRSRVSDGQLLDRTSNEGPTASIIRFSPDGTRLVTARPADAGTSLLRVIDMR